MDSDTNAGLRVPAFKAGQFFYIEPLLEQLHYWGTNTDHELLLVAEHVIKELVKRMGAANDHLMNLQPHIAQLPKQCQGFIDPHVDEAMKLLSSLSGDKHEG